MNLAKLLMLVLAAVLAAGPALAGNTAREGTAGAQELRIPVSARGIALGNGYIADVTGPEATFYNPAGIAAGSGTQVYLSRMNWIADIDKNFVAATMNTGIGAFGLMVDVLQIGDIEETTEQEPEGTGRIFSPNFTVVGVSYSRFLTDAVSAGLTAKLINESVLQTTATGFAFDIGVRYQPGWKNLRLALLLKDFGPNMKYNGSNFESFHQTNDNPQANPRSLATESAAFELPSVFEIGVAYGLYQSGDNSVEGFGTFLNNNFGADEYQFGAEYRFRDILALRGGYVATDADGYNYGPSFGVGLGVPVGGTSRVSVDYGHRIVKDFFDDNRVLSVKFDF